jgi:hypothetical protein
MIAGRQLEDAMRRMYPLFIAEYTRVHVVTIRREF